MAKAGHGLGSGLGSLFEQNTADTPGNVETLRTADIEPNRSQPRRRFDDDALTELAESIQTHGMLQPIVVRPVGEKRWQIVAGERRWRAAKRIGLSEVPVIIRNLSDRDAAQIALIENLQREDLNPIEEASGYQALIRDFGLTQEQVAKTVGRSRPAVANALRLLSLPVIVQDLLEKRKITAGHAKALAGVKDEALMLELARRAAEDKITVRDIEAAAQRLSAAPAPPPQKTQEEIYYAETEISLSQLLGRKVFVQKGKKKGTLILEFYDRDDLQGLCRLLEEATEEND